MYVHPKSSSREGVFIPYSPATEKNTKTDTDKIHFIIREKNSKLKTKNVEDKCGSQNFQIK